MTTKLEQAARQALSAMEDVLCYAHMKTSAIFPEQHRNWDEFLDDEITALREALAEQPRLDVDLSDDEILMCVKSQSIIETVRRAIHAYKEKNK